MMNCTFCASPKVTEVMDFGSVALAGAFLKPEHFATEKRYPLRIVFCEQCYALQVAYKVEAETLFTNYFYFSSAIQPVKDHARRYAESVVRRFKPGGVLEIGCNDGVLLRNLQAQGVPVVVGVDPANVVESIAGVDVVNDFFNEKSARSIHGVHGPVDMVIANNVLAHIPDIHSTMRGVLKMLKAGGVLVCEVHDLGAMLRELQYDWIYHEHLYYHSFLSLEKHLSVYGLQIFDVEEVGMHGGSRRYYAGKPGHHAIQESVQKARARDFEQGLQSFDTFAAFAKRVFAHRDALVAAVESLKGRVVAYGASGRANAVLQFAGLDSSRIEYVIDDAPAKHGFYTPGTHIPIHPSAKLRDAPENVLVLAWNYLDQIAPKCGRSNLIVPFPEVRTIDRRLAA